MLYFLGLGFMASAVILNQGFSSSAETVRHLFGRSKPLNFSKTFSVSARLLTIADWPERSAQAQWCVATLAKQCGVSVATLERHFLKTMRACPHDWMTGLRLDQARTRLQNGAAVKQVAAEAHYVHVQHFSRDFKKQYGRSPSEFRRLPAA